MELQQYDFQIKHRPGKANANADALSRIHEDPVKCYMVSIVPSGLNNEEMPEKTLNIGKCYGCQEKRPFLEKYSIQGKSFLCCQSCNINLKDNEEICERCHKSALCTDEWDIYHDFNSYCSIIGDAYFINDGHHTILSVNEELKRKDALRVRKFKRNYKRKKKSSIKQRLIFEENATWK
ncbi:hypothetical protein RclHR1_01430002 [Rhizophagus clarus]|uniref:Reverse transcriptase RNase H-like domain-containing protein n=1 Tax=Rhizophagus clarus TaxID=94130 RepID=A0A2Z6QC65_9GLOM|nr:hypothetical protein RclHR1_01430002 [Rhizophagus clarus]GES99858.1 hypothetical protein GLOIN_2v1882338 [Rhizophagus clarus]